MSRRMRRHFSPLKCCSICCARARAWSSTTNHFTKSILMVNLVSVAGRFRCTSLRERNCKIVGFGSERRVLQVVAQCLTKQATWKNPQEQLHQKTKKQHINQQQKQDTVFKFGCCKRQNLGSKVKMLGVNKRLPLKKSELESTD